MEDTIYRHQAIDAVAEELNRINIHVQNVAIARIKDKLNKLPSAQPTQTNADSTHENTLDCVSRQAVIDIVRNRVKRFTTACVLAVTEIENLPPAQQEENLKSCKNCTHFAHAYKLPCKNCRRNEMLPDWYEEACNNG